MMPAPMLLNVERNTSGDSTTTSGSTASTGIVVVSVENSPAPQPVNGNPVITQPSSSVAARSPSFTYPTAGFANALSNPALGGTFVFQGESLTPSQTGAIMLPAHVPVSRLDVPSTSPPRHHLPSPQTHPPLPPVEHLYTDRSKAEEMQEVLPPPLAFADTVMASGMASTGVLVDHGHGYPSQSSHSSGALSSSSSFTQGGAGGSMDSGHVLSDESSSAHHSTQVRGVKERGGGGGESSLA